MSFLYGYYCTKGEKYCTYTYSWYILRKVKKIVFPRSLKVNTSIHKTEVQNWCTKLPNQSSDWRRVHNRAGGTRGQEGRAPYPTTQILADQVIQFQPVGTLLLNEGIPRALKGKKLRLKIPRVLPLFFELFLVFQI